MSGDVADAWRPYVVLYHQCPAGSARPSHWDFMLSTGATLRTWALPEEPTADKRLLADALSDHRLEYLQYEGPLTGNRGSVTRWDAGQYQVECDEPGRLVVRLRGGRLQGLATLEPLAGEEAAQRWSFSFRKG